MTRAYYNENNPEAAAWLRELIRRNLIAPGDVDERSIEDVKPGDLRGYRQAHFFAGIGGWSYALRLAGWPDDQPVWTGSCPCQPFSAAGKRAGFEDERHLWPAWFHLIRQCGPAVVLGEQVASRDGLDWLDLVQADLEGAGYASGAADLCAAGVGAPHIRQRLWFVADADGERHHGLDALLRPEAGRRDAGDLLEAAGCGAHCGLVDADRAAQERLGRLGLPLEPQQEAGRSSHAASWANATPIQCADGVARPIEPSIQPVAHGIPARLVRLRGYGNAINPEVAAAFIRAYREARNAESLRIAA